MIRRTVARWRAWRDHNRDTWRFDPPPVIRPGRGWWTWR